MSRLPAKVALLSHVLPPSPSGQATVIHRLFGGMPPGSCTPISRTDYGNPAVDASGAPRLPFPYRHVPLSPPPGRLMRLLGRGPADALSEARREIRWRARQVERLLRPERCGVLIACSGDLHDLPAAELASRRLGIPFVAWMFDDYLYQWTGSRREVAGRYEPLVVRGAAALVVPNEAAGDAFFSRYGVRAVVIGNPCELPDLGVLDAAPGRFPADETAIVYAGSVYHAHHDAFRNLIESIRRIRRPGLKLHLFTSQSEADLALGGVSGDFVVRHPHVPPSEIPGILRQADILFLPLAFSSPIPEVIRTSAPGKMGEYLSVGRPVLVHAPPDSFVSRYFRENGCGVVVDRDDPGVLAEALQRMIEGGEATAAIARAARQAAGRDFGIEEARSRLRSLLDSIGGSAG